MYRYYLKYGMIYFDIVISNQPSRLLNSDSEMIEMLNLTAERYLSELDFELQIK